MMGKLSKSRTPKKGGYWFIYLFGFIFLSVGLFMGSSQISLVSKSVIAQGWAEVPASVQDAQMKYSSGSEGGTTYKAVGSYRYEWDGKSYSSSRLFFTKGFDSDKNYHRKIVRAMKSSQNGDSPLIVRVNPSQPDQAVAFSGIRWKHFGFMSIFTIVFGGIGTGIIALAMFGKRQEGREAERQLQFPEQPWLWRDEWQSPELKNNSKAGLLVALAFTFLWNAISWPIAFQLPQLMREEKEWWIAIFFLFPIIGLFAIAWSWNSYRQYRRYGAASFVLKSYPGALGYGLAGSLHVPRAPVPGAEFEVRFSSIRKTTTGSGEDRRTVETVLWQDEQFIPATAGRDFGGYKLPIMFKIPKGLEESTSIDSDRPVLWRLTIKSELGAVDFDQAYEVPVFDPELWRIKIPASIGLSEEAQGSAFEYQGDWSRTGVIYSEQSNGSYYYFPPARHKGLAATVTFMTLIFGGVGVGTMAADVPVFFGIIFSLVGIFLGIWAVHMWLFKSAIDVREGQMTVRRGLFSGKYTEISVENIKDISLDSTMSSGEVKYYDIVARLKSGDKLKLADHLLGKRDVENLISQIWGDLGVSQS